MLSLLQENFAGNGVQILGIALDDPQKAREFASKLSIRYPIQVGTIDTVLAGRQYGNREGMLPYSVLVDADGIVRWAYLGALDKDELETQIKALL